MSRVEVRVIEGGPIKIGEQIVALSQTTRVDLEEANSMEEASTEDLKVPEPTDDVRAPTNRPNGFVTAAIAPKMPKSGGETKQIPIEGGRTAERQVEELGKATQGGGPESEDTVTTPGDQPDSSQTNDRTAAAQKGVATPGPAGGKREDASRKR